MADTHRNSLLHYIRHLIGSDPTADMTDRQLLERFLDQRDETAVEALVRRYGPLVFGVCRRILRNDHTAQDAFQATFLVLIRKAPTLIYCERLGGWLYRVAYRLALRARANEARRRQREARAARREADTAGHDSTTSELVVALEEELQRLPERHRVPLVLCYLEGKTNEQAALILGCPQGSMSARLAQARERLRVSLSRRGYTVVATGISSLLVSAAAEAAVPLPLFSNTVRAALWFFRAESASTDFVSTQAVTLARQACRAMLVSKLKIPALILASAMLGTGATMVLKAAPQTDPPGQVVSQSVPDKRPEKTERLDERLPKDAIARMGTTKLRHGGPVFFAAYTPDGKSLVTAGRDRTVRLWDLATSKEIRRFDWAEAPPDGKEELSQDEASEKQLQQELDDLALSGKAALSPDAKIVAASRGGLVWLWETASGKKLHCLQTGQKRLVHLAFSINGASLATLSPNGRAFAVWDVVSGRCLRSIQIELPASYDRSGSVFLNDQDAIVSPSFQYVAYQWRDPTGVRQIRIRELATGKEPPPIHAGGFGGTLAFCFSADEKTLMWDEWYSGNGIVFSEVATGKELRRLGDKRAKDGTYTGRPELTLAISHSPDGRYLALCRESHTIELWDLGSGKSTYPTGKPTMAQLYHRFPDSVGALVRPALAFSSDSKMLISSLGGAALHQFRVDTGKITPEPVSAHRAPVCTLALSADGKSLATFGSGDPIRFWEWPTGKESKEEGLPATATHVVFASGGQFAFAVGNQITFRGNGGAKTWPLADEDFPPLMALALSPDGTVLASRNFDNPEVQLWDATGKHRRSLGRLDEGPRFVADGTREAAGVVVPDVVFSPDGRCLAGAGPRRQLCLWDVDTGNVLWEQPSQAGQVIERFAFSPSGHMLASVQADGTVTLYETSNGAKRAQLGEADQKNQKVYLSYDYYGRVRVHPTRRTSPVCLAFSPDGRYLAMAKDTPTIHLWDVLEGRQVGQLKGHEGGVVSLLFSPDGKHLFSGGADTTVLTWDLARFINRSTGRSAQLQDPALEALWSDLSSKDAVQAFTAMRQLCVSPDEALRLVKQHVQPARVPTPEKLANLIADLDSSRFERRRRAETELAEFGELAESALRQALAEGPPLNLRQRLEQLLDRMSNVPPITKLRELRAVEVLELIGTPEAHQVLEGLAGGTATARLTQQAKKAIHRLGQQPPTGQ